MRIVSKLVAIALVLCCVLLTSACRGEHADLEPFSDAIKESAPVNATVSSEIVSELGVVGADYEASYRDGVITVNYTKSVLGKITADSDADALISSVEGVATVNSDGSVTGELGALIKSVLMLSIELKGDKIAYTAEDGLLSFTVTAENTESVFGVDIGYDVEVLITVSSGVVNTLSIMYAADSGPVSILCEYAY